MNTLSNGFDFNRRAREVMLEKKFNPDFSPAILAETNAFQPEAIHPAANCKDLRDLAWSSIDNTESRDLDQVEWAESLPNGSIRVLVGIADVDSLIKPGSAIDAHAKENATSVYTGGPVFPMLPERLSTNLTSLGQNAERPAMVMEFVSGNDGSIQCSGVSAALIRNHARLNYDQVGRWLDGKAPSPSDSPLEDGIEAQLRLQDQAAKRLQEFRKQNGALTLGGVETVPIVVNNEVKSFAAMQQNRARDIIESFMVAANMSMALFLREHKALCLRRVVRTPKRWDRIQEIASGFGTRLPDQPDPRALGDFLARQKQNDPVHFPELSLAVLKSLGPGEYIVEHPGAESEGHFGLAVHDYTHSTAPNRRYADLVMQRLLKACVNSATAPYGEEELAGLAAHCTERESAARDVERYMKKVAAALFLRNQIGRTFVGIVTGVTPKGTFARLMDESAEGRIVRGDRGLDVGAKVSLRLLATEPGKGFIDFAANPGS